MIYSKDILQSLLRANEIFSYVFLDSNQTSYKLLGLKRLVKLCRIGNRVTTWKHSLISFQNLKGKKKLAASHLFHMRKISAKDAAKYLKPS